MPEKSTSIKEGLTPNQLAWFVTGVLIVATGWIALGDVASIVERTVQFVLATGKLLLVPALIMAVVLFKRWRAGVPLWRSRSKKNTARRSMTDAPAGSPTAVDPQKLLASGVRVRPQLLITSGEERSKTRSELADLNWGQFLARKVLVLLLALVVIFLTDVIHQLGTWVVSIVILGGGWLFGLLVMLVIVAPAFAIGLFSKLRSNRAQMKAGQQEQQYTSQYGEAPYEPQQHEYLPPAPRRALPPRHVRQQDYDRW